jgi:GT2 family glycosyltransferase
MLSVIIPVRNTREFASTCLVCASRTFAALGGAEDFEFILIDDDSDPASGIVELFRQFRESVPFKTTIAHLKQRQYYTYACALGMSLARGSEVLLLSHDMIVTPPYVKWLREAAASDASVGTVRGASEHVDLFPQHVITPPLPLRTFEDVCSFSRYVGRYYGPDVVEDRFLIGDSFLVKRAVIDRIGVMDTTYRHLLGDVDFGLRVQRAGFKLVCAKGAWLHHEGSGHTKSLLASG